MTRVDAIVITLLFQGGWWGTVALADTAFASASLLFPAIMVVFLSIRGLTGRAFWNASLVVSGVGILFDAMLSRMGLVSFVASSSEWLPEWLIAVWLLFATSMLAVGRQFRWPWWGATLAGALGGPLSYQAAEAFHLMRFDSSWALWVYAVFWAVAFPVVLAISQRYLVMGEKPAQ